MYAGDETYGDDVTSGPATDEPTPSINVLKRWSWEGQMEATDGCGPIEDDGHCEHGKPSWLLHLGFI